MSPSLAEVDPKWYLCPKGAVVEEKSLSPLGAHQDNAEHGWGRWRVGKDEPKLHTGSLPVHRQGALGSPSISTSSVRGAVCLHEAHLLGPLHHFALSELLIGVPEEHAQLLLDQGDGYLGHRQAGHLCNDISHAPRPFHNHTGGPTGDGVVDGLQQSRETGP